MKIPRYLESTSHYFLAVFRVSILSDWKALTDALLSEKPAQELTDAAVTNLAHALRAAVHKAAGGVLVVSHHEGRLVKFATSFLNGIFLA